MNRIKLYFLLLLSSSFIHSSGKTIRIEDIDTLQYAAMQAAHKHLQELGTRAFAILDDERRNNATLQNYKNNEDTDTTVHDNADFHEIIAQQEKNLVEFELTAQNYTNFNGYPLRDNQRLSLLDMKNDINQTILDVTIANDDENIMKILLDHGINVFMCDKDRNNYFHQIARHRRHKVASVMLNYIPKDDNYCPQAEQRYLAKMAPIKRTAINMRNLKGQTPLHLATNHHNIALIAIFAQAQANGFLQNDEGSTPLATATSSYHGPTSLALLNNFYQGADHDLNSFKTQSEGSSYLHLLMSQSYYTDVTPALKIILPKLTDINYQNNDGITALHLCVSHDSGTRIAALKLLLQYNPNINFKNNTNLSPLYTSLQATDSDADNESSFKILLDAGANYTSRYDKDRNSLLHIIAQENYQIHARQLLQHDATIVNTTNNKEQTPLHAAIINHYTQMAILLAQHGASLRAKDKNGKTPLQYLNGQELPMHQPSQEDDFKLYYNNNDVTKQLMKAHRKYLMSQRPILEQIQIARDKKRKASEL